MMALCSDKSTRHGGFSSLRYTGPAEGDAQTTISYSPYDTSHITMVYTALCSLITLGDDLSRVDRPGVLSGILALQCPKEPGLFNAGFVCAERDVRFVFSAVASCYILNGLDRLDKDAIVTFIGRAHTYEGGFACLPGLEAHAGATYCTLATLSLLDCLDQFLPVGSRAREKLIKWLVSLQSQGFHGRSHKPDDSCYTFWVCASLKLLGCEYLVNEGSLLKFIAKTWDDCTGGFRKLPDPTCSPDPLHTFLAISGLSCLASVSGLNESPPNDELFENGHLEDGDSCAHGNVTTNAFHLQEFLKERLTTVHPGLNVSQAAHDHLLKLHQQWLSL